MRWPADIPASAHLFVAFAAELTDTLEAKGDLAKARAVKLKPGARLVREWHGRTHDVLVTEAGFLWRSETWRSLTAIAREITGTHWSGPRFFGLPGSPRPDHPIRSGTGRGQAAA